MLTQNVESYLAVRRAMGFALHSEGTLLQSFAAFSEAAGKDHVCTETAIEWAGSARSTTTRARRLGQVIRFARYIRAEDQRHEMPPAVFGCEKGPRPTPYIFQGEEVWTTDAMLQSTFYNEFLKKVDVVRMACVAFCGSPGIFEGFSIYRGPHEDDFGREELVKLAEIVPHLQTALYTRRKLLDLESRVSDMETALDALSTALVLVDAAYKIFFANRNARAILACRDGLMSDGGRLMAQDSTECAALRGVLAGAINFGTGKTAPNPRATLISRARKRSLQLVAVPCRPETLATPKKAAALVFITDPDQKVPARAETLQALFRLTRAEVKLATVLLEGKSLSEAANLNQVGRETVRSQLKSIFLKTGARRQSELIGLLVKLPGDNM